MREAIREAMLAEARRLEEQAVIFLRMGYTVDELTVVRQQGWSLEPDCVIPKSMLPLR